MNQQLENIPYLWSALAFWLATAFFAALLPKRLKLWKGILTLALFLPIMVGYMYVTVPQNGTAFNLLMAGFALLTLMPLGLVCRLDLRQVIYFGARAFVLGGFTSAFAWQMYTYFTQRGMIPDAFGAQTLFMLFLYALTAIIAFVLERPGGKVGAELPLPWSVSIGTAIMTLLIYIFSSISFAPVETPFGGSTYSDAFKLRSIIYMWGLAMQHAAHIQLCQNHVRLERDTLESMLNMQYMNYRLNQESVDLINRKYHDLKHQIAILRSEIGTEQKLDYLDRMEQEIQVYEANNKTGNRLLDTILTGKSVHCQNEGIKLTCVADGQALDFMDPIDLCSLFGNALDNAIEAVSQVQDPEQRLIHLSVSRQKGFLRIRLENRYEGKVKLANGIPVTTKSDARFHGFGVKSIMAAAEKYGGSATMETKEGWFELRVLIPIQG